MEMELVPMGGTLQGVGSQLKDVASISKDTPLDWEKEASKLEDGWHMVLGKKTGN